MNWRKLLLSADGRIGRKSFWLFLVVAIGVGLVASFTDGLVFDAGGPGEEAGPISAVFNLALIYPSICVQSKRWHDLGRSGWFQALPIGVTPIAAPLLIAGGQTGAALAAGLIVAAYGSVIVCMGFFKGQAAPNKYGEPNSGDRDVTPVAEVFS